MDDETIVAMIAVPSRAAAETLARALVETRLAACVQALPISSTYRWEGAVTESAEVLLLAKTRAALFPALEAAVVELHEYAVPEIVAIPFSAGHEPYLDWLLAETRTP